ncbi:MAG: type II toxin-antitoxin system HicA family toxin [Chloroflexota bacterium]
MPKYPIVRAEDVFRSLQRDGWRLVRSRGSHHQFKHDKKPGLVTLSIHSGKDVHPQTLKSILRQANIPLRMFRRYLKGGR